MKTKILTIISLLVISIGIETQKPAQATEQLALNLCTYAKGDDRIRMRSQLRDQRVNLRNVYSGVRCDGLTLIQFATSNQSTDIAEFMVSQLPSTIIEDNREIEWFEENNLTDSSVYKSLKDRLNYL